MVSALRPQADRQANGNGAAGGDVSQTRAGPAGPEPAVPSTSPTIDAANQRDAAVGPGAAGAVGTQVTESVLPSGPALNGATALTSGGPVAEMATELAPPARESAATTEAEPLPTTEPAGVSVDKPGATQPSGKQPIGADKSPDGGKSTDGEKPAVAEKPTDAGQPADTKQSTETDQPTDAKQLTDGAPTIEADQDAAGEEAALAGQAIPAAEAVPAGSADAGGEPAPAPPQEDGRAAGLDAETAAVPGGAGAAAAILTDQGGGGASGAAVPSAAGGEPQAGTEDDGEAELEEQLAKADPERAAADEADPEDIIAGEPPDEASEPIAALPELPDVDSEQGAELELERPELTAVASELPSTSLTGDGPEPTAAVEADEDPPSADGFTGDEPALGGGALGTAASAPVLSDAEKQAALGSIGQSSGPAPAGGGGGGGAALPDKSSPEAPDVSTETPAAALAKLGGLPPVELAKGLGGVNAAVAKSSADKRSDLAANPPSIERPTGSPTNLHGGGAAETDGDSKEGKRAAPVPEGQDQPVPEPDALPEPPPSPVEQIREPAVSDSEGDDVSPKMTSALGSMPTSDPGLQADAGPAPSVELSGNADPAQADQQRTELQASVGDTQAAGRADVAKEMGENTKIYPSVPPETLTAKVPQSGGPATGAGAGPAAGAADPEALSIIANKEKGGEIQAALGKAQGDLSAKNQEYATKVGEEKAESAKDIAELEIQSAADQSTARAKAQAEVRAKKGEWTSEQERTIGEANTEADAEMAKGRKEVQSKKQAADTEAGKHIRKGNEEAERERRKAEDKAAKEKAKGKKEGGGFFGWLASKAKAFFNKIKAAVKAAFDLARKLIKKAIEAAKKAAMWAIEQARKAIVAAIKAVGRALIAIGDRVLAAFPKLRAKFRKAVQDTVDKAVAKVNEYAEGLKKGVAAALDALAAGLDKLVGWLEKGMLAVVDAYAAVVQGAIKLAEKVAQALGVFVVLIKDIAAGPGRWLANLAAGAVDGIKNHLWKAFKEAVQEWFNSKLEQVLGLGKMVWGLIKSGGLSLAAVGKMAWEGIKSLIPPTLIRILVEKLVAMIVPAAGAVMVIIDGLKAAWGAVQRILSAFQKFVAFLKAVKSGPAGPPFAKTLAAAAVAVIDFVANWLIAKLAKGAAKVGGKIKGLAKKLLGRKKGKKKAKKRKGKDKPAKGKAKKPSPKSKKAKGKGKDRKADRKKKKEDKKRQRLEKAKRELPPKVKRLLQKGVSRPRLWLQLQAWKLKYRLKTLKVDTSGQRVKISARINPEIELAEGWTYNSFDIFRIIDNVARDMIQSAGAQPAESETSQRRGGDQPTELDTSVPGRAAASLRPGAAFQIGETESGRPVGYSSRESGFYRGKTQRIGSISGGGGMMYPALAGRLEGEDIPELLDTVRRGEQLGLSDEKADALGELFGLWFAHEPSHPKKTGGHRRDLVYSHMMTDLLRRGEAEPGSLTGEEPRSVTRALREHPASSTRDPGDLREKRGKVKRRGKEVPRPYSAQAGAQEVTRRIEDPTLAEPREGTDVRLDYDVRYEREKKLIEDWFKRHRDKLKVFKEKPTLDQVETFVRSKIRELVPTRSAPG